MEVEADKHVPKSELPWGIYALQVFVLVTGATGTYCLVLSGSWISLIPGCSGLLLCGLIYCMAPRVCARHHVDANRSAA